MAAGAIDVDHAEFRRHMEPLAAALEVWAVEWVAQPEAFGYLPAAGSRAMTELHAERQWSIPSWAEPARNAHSYGLTLCYVLAEHLAAYAAILRTEVGPAFSHLPTIRAILEAAPIARWLLATDISLETRIKRSIVYRLDSANQIGRLVHTPSAVAYSKRVRDDCKDFTNTHGWTWTGVALDCEVLPTATSFSEVTMGRAFPELDQTLWNLTSAAQHGTWYVFGQNIKDGFVAGGPLDPTGGLAALTVRSDQLAMLGVAAWQGCRSVSVARNELMGWDPAPAMAGSERRLESIARGIVASTRSS